MQIQSNLTVLIAEQKLPSVNVITSSRKVLRSKRRTRSNHFGLTQVKAEPIRRFSYEEPWVKLEYRGYKGAWMHQHPDGRGGGAQNGRTTTCGFGGRFVAAALGRWVLSTA